jgi:acyl carrier protein
MSDTDTNRRAVMQNPYSRQQIDTVVCEGLARVLGIPAEEITPGARLVDLGAESLDMVEFRFEMESLFGVSLPKQSVLDHLAAALGGSERLYDDAGRISALAADVLLLSSFGYSPDEVTAGMRPYEIMMVGTSEHWASFIHAIFEHLPETCTECTATSARVSAVGRAECASCGTRLVPLAGDRVTATDVRNALGALDQLVG